MAPSTPASPTADARPQPVDPVAAAGLSSRRRGIVSRFLATPSGFIGSGLTLALVVIALLADALAPFDPFSPVGPPLAGPSAEHWMGTDALGRDLLSGIILGTRTSLIVAGSVGVLTLVLGVLIGGTSGYVAGRVDDVLQRGTELLMVLPRFFLAIVVIALFGPGLDRLIAVLGLTSWTLLSRVVRAEVLSLREREFVEAARSIGASEARILARHVLPNALPAALTYLGLVLAQVILLEASLGFLGLGDPNTVSWGFLAGQAQRFLRSALWLSFFPGMAIVVAVLGLNLVVDALNDVLAGRR
jgi:peptide/nickel transport system permease protein